MTNFIFLHCKPLRLERAITCHGGEERDRSMDVSVCVCGAGEMSGYALILSFLLWYIDFQWLARLECNKGAIPFYAG